MTFGRCVALVTPLLHDCYMTVILPHSTTRQVTKLQMAAEEAVLWELSGRLMGCLDDVESVSVTFGSCNCYSVAQRT
jgi:hypothetical protein